MKRITALLLLLLTAVLVTPALAQEAAIVDLEDFVAKGFNNELTNAQVDAYTATWTESDLFGFYIEVVKQAGIGDPNTIAKAWLIEDNIAKASREMGEASNFVRSNYGPTWLTRRYSPHWSQLSAGGAGTNQTSCDNDATDTEYIFQYWGQSAAGVSSMQWYSDNSWIGMILGNVAAYGTHQFTNICVGDTRICAIGGIYGCNTGAIWTQHALKLIP